MCELTVTTKAKPGLPVGEGIKRPKNMLFIVNDHVRALSFNPSHFLVVTVHVMTLPVIFS